MQYAVYAVLSICSTRCMLYLVLTLDYSMERWKGMLNFVFLGDGRIEDTKERDERVRVKSS
jgi:hypothetical protein